MSFSVDTSKNFADKKNHTIMIIQAKNSQYSVTKLFTLPFKDISQILYTNTPISNIRGINQRYHNHIAWKYAINIPIDIIERNSTTFLI